jgi:hypothetical protein
VSRRLETLVGANEPWIYEAAIRVASGNCSVVMYIWGG